MTLEAGGFIPSNVDPLDKDIHAILRFGGGKLGISGILRSRFARSVSGL